MSKFSLIQSGRKIFILLFSLLFLAFLQNCDDNGTDNDELKAPSSLTIVDDNPSNFQISWKDNSDDETGFSIERKKDSGSFAEIVAVGADITEYTDTITEGGEYSYRVRAVKGTEYSDYSNTVSETIAAPTEHTTNITASETWAAGIHIIDGYVYVSNGAVLTIEAGSIVKFKESAALVIQTNSGLIADGTAGTITFTGVAAENGYWRFIQFNDDALNASCRLINCVIEYGGGYSSSSAELVINNNATVTNCTVRFSSSNGVIIDNAARPSFDNNTITLNDLSPIAAGFTSAASIGVGSYTGNVSDFIDLDNGTITENGTILKQDVPYRMNNYNYVENSTLTIAAGASFLMNVDAALVIDTNGGLTATGTELDSIKFTGFAEQKGYWRFVVFEDDALDANCNLDYCIFEYGGGYSSNSATVVINNDATITNSAVRNSSTHGVEISAKARPTFDNNTISMNNKSPIHGDFESMTSIGYGDYNGNTSDFIDLDSGTLTEVGTLKKQNVPYRLNSYNYIEEATLTIEAGTIVYLNQDAALVVNTNGGMIAQGTMDDSVYFSSNVAQNGYWRFIHYTDVAKDADCIMDYCQIEYGGGYSTNSASLVIDNDADITNSTIRYSLSNGVLIDDEQANPTISNCTVTLNDKSPIRADFEHLGSIGYGDYNGNDEDFLEIDSGTLTETMTLKKQNVPYRFNNYNYVNNATLSIEAGTTIQMNNAASLIIDENGGLIADGTSETITFTGYVASNGYWRFIVFQDDAIDENCELTHCILEYGGGYSSSSGIVDIQNVPTVTDNTIRHSSSYGIVYDIDAGAHGDYLSDNTFSDNTAGDVNGY
ncbi:MAG: fibronectin type III domain-containing protein [Calditrichaceae bacterium]|nr:fibronectin type III domain-containing protein [Calditrichaceae bacterium]